MKIGFPLAMTITSGKPLLTPPFLLKKDVACSGGYWKASKGWHRLTLLTKNRRHEFRRRFSVSFMLEEDGSLGC
jgi:hypothetical protein